MTDKNDIFLKALHDNFMKAPFHHFLGLDSDCFDIEKKCIRFDMHDEFVGNKSYNVLHGGVIASLFDIEGAFILLLDSNDHFKRSITTVRRKFKGSTINLHIDYLKPGIGKHFIVTGSILHYGNKVAMVRSEIRNEQEELIAVGTGTYLI